MRVIQLLVTLQKGDAIGNLTLLLHDFFLSQGFDSQIYAYNIGSNIDKKTAQNIKYLKGIKKDDLLIYHMCEGHEINDIVKCAKSKKIAVYHNTTPPVFFEQFGRELKIVQEKSQKVISELKEVFDRCIADSEFNKQDLILMGYDKNKIDVIPVMLDFDDYKKIPDKATIEKYNDEFVNILFVGRIVPNKKQEDIIRSFAYYHKFVNDKSRLFLIGSPFIKDYDYTLKRYIDYLEIQDSVIMPGHSSFEEILAYYSCADIFLCMSEHEGFCVPLLEAMMFDVPIIAYNSTAIPFTLESSGVITDSKEPKEVAVLIEKIVKNDEYRMEIVNIQKKRLRDFEPERLKKMYLNSIEKVLGENI